MSPLRFGNIKVYFFVFLWVCVEITDSTNVGPSCVFDQKLPQLPLHTFKNKHYYLSPENQMATFMGALSFCAKHGMQLLSIESAEEDNFLKRHALANFRTDRVFWTSGTQGGPCMGTISYAWITTGQAVSYRNFAAGQPDNAGNNERCIEWIYRINLRVTHWNDDTCSKSHNFICETVPPPPCSCPVSITTTTPISTSTTPISTTTPTTTPMSTTSSTTTTESVWYWE